MITLATAHSLGVRTFGMGGDDESQDEETFVELQIQAAHEVLKEVAGGTWHISIIYTINSLIQLIQLIH